MSFLSREEMKDILVELQNSETSEARRLEIFNQIGDQHVSGLEEKEQLEKDFKAEQKFAKDLQQANAISFAQQQQEKFKNSTDPDPEDLKQEYQETVTIDDLIKNGGNK